MSKRSQPPSPNVRLPKHSRIDAGQHSIYSHPATPSNFSHSAGETWAALGACATTMGTLPLAVHSFEHALMHTPGNLPALLGWSHALRASDTAAQDTRGCIAAVRRLAAAAEQYPDVAKSADLYRELSECYLLVGSNEQASQAAQQAIALRPTDPSLFILGAQSLARLGLRQQAAASLQHCLQLLPAQIQQLAPSDVETARTAHAELAAIAAAEGNVEGSIAELTATLMLPPPSPARLNEHVALWCALATALERAGRIPEAIDACARAEAGVGYQPRILLTHAYLLLLGDSRAQAQQAVALLGRVVANEPSPEDASGDFLPWCLLGKAHTILDAPRAAYDAYQIALRRADGSPITWLAVGKLYLELRQLPDALAAYSQALRLQLNENSPGTAAAWDGLSCVYERCDDQLTDAADACSRAAQCFRAYGDSKSADFYDSRARSLRLASSGKAPVPQWSEPVGVPNYFLRDLVALLPHERIALVRSANKQEQAEASKETARENARENAAPASPSDKARDQTSSYQASSSTHQSQAPRSGQAYESSAPTPSPGPSQLATAATPQAAQAHPYAPALSYKSDAKSPIPPPHQLHQQLPPPGRQYWASQEHPGTPGHTMMRGPAPLSGHYGPPPAGMMSPPIATPPASGGPHRSPAALPSVSGEAYPVQMAPGYPYGQYMPVHNGMVAQAQPYGSAHWR